MSPAPKALAYGMFLEITIVVLVVISLAAIAALSALGSRKRNYALEDTNAPHFIRSANDHSSGLNPRALGQELSRAEQHSMLRDAH